MGILLLDQFLCWKLKVAVFAVAAYLIGSAAVGGILEIIDIAAQADHSLEIQGGFQAAWRSHVWEGWLACNIVMLVCHIVVVAYSVLMMFAVAVFPTYYEYGLTKGYLILVIIYILVELGTACYKYSWYGPNTFRLPFLVFTFLFWIIRALMNMTSALVIHSRIKETEYEIKYGEKKMLSPYENLMSGRATPNPSGIRTPHSYA